MICNNLKPGFYFSNNFPIDSPNNILPCPCPNCINKFSLAFNFNFTDFLYFSRITLTSLKNISIFFQTKMYCED